MLNCLIIILVFPKLLRKWIELNLADYLQLNTDLEKLSEKDKGEAM